MRIIQKSNHKSWVINFDTHDIGLYTTSVLKWVLTQPIQIMYGHRTLKMTLIPPPTPRAWSDPFKFTAWVTERNPLPAEPARAMFGHWAFRGGSRNYKLVCPVHKPRDKVSQGLSQSAMAEAWHWFYSVPQIWIRAVIDFGSSVIGIERFLIGEQC